MRLTTTPGPAADRLGPDPFFDPEVVLDPAPFDTVVGPGGADGLFTAVPVLMGLVALVVVVIVVVKLAQAGQTFATNSSQPERTVSARVVARRSEADGGGDTPVRTLYFATFEITGGERLEMKVPSRQYGLLADGDEGQLTHQGTWFRRFERRRVIPLDRTWEAPGGSSLAPPPPD